MPASSKRALAQIAPTAEFQLASDGRDKRLRAARAPPPPPAAAAAAAVAGASSGAGQRPPVDYPPEMQLPALEVPFRDVVMTACPRPTAKRGKDSEEFIAMLAAWRAADETAERKALRTAREKFAKRARRPPTAADSERRVRQRQEDAGQQQRHVGARQLARACASLALGRVALCARARATRALAHARVRTLRARARDARPRSRARANPCVWHVRRPYDRLSMRAGATMGARSGREASQRP